jgi:hypothetical protein
LDFIQLAPWMRWSSVLLGISFLLFAFPSRLEGPTLIRISPDHAIAALDALATASLLVATALIYRGIWCARTRLLGFLQRHPGPACTALFAAGLGLGLLFASVFSGYAGWWAIGALLFTAILLAAASLAARP